MKTDNIYACILAAAVVALATVSCVKDTLHRTPHPGSGALVFTADFSGRSASCPLPAQYGIAVGAAQECTAPSGQAYCHPVLFAPGTYRYMAWNSCDGVTVSGGTARIDAVSAGEIEPMPGYLFTSQGEVTVTKDDTVRVALSMAQRTRDFHFDFTLTEGDPELVESVTGRLDGVAGAFDIAAQSVVGDAVAISLVFSRSGDKLSADARLLGIVGRDQTLTMEIAFTDRPQRKTTSVSLSEAMASFHGDMHIGLDVDGELATPVAAGATATITGWKNMERAHSDAL